MTTAEDVYITITVRVLHANGQPLKNFIATFAEHGSGGYTDRAESDPTTGVATLEVPTPQRVSYIIIRDQLKDLTVQGQFYTRTTIGRPDKDTTVDFILPDCASSTVFPPLPQVADHEVKLECTSLTIKVQLADGIFIRNSMGTLRFTTAIRWPMKNPQIGPSCLKVCIQVRSIRMYRSAAFMRGNASFQPP
jgi:hypothetical protein